MTSRRHDRRTVPRPLLLAVALATAAACAGCGLGRAARGTGVSLLITRDFGARPVRTITRGTVPRSESVQQMLARTFPVRARPVKPDYTGGQIEAIGGLVAGAGHAWSLYVNGVKASRAPAKTSIHAGDRIWFDLHDASAISSAPAVVGAFPEPFVHGVGGKRLPTTLECGAGVAAACRTVTRTLRAAGVPVASQYIGSGSGPDTLGVVVAPWRQISGQLASELVAHGPSSSGVWARFSGTTNVQLELLDSAGRVARTLGADAGLIAATADNSSVPTWLITGTDAAGVTAAARSLTAAALRGHYAVAVDAGRRLPVPLRPGG